MSIFWTPYCTNMQDVTIGGNCEEYTKTLCTFFLVTSCESIIFKIKIQTKMRQMNFIPETNITVLVYTYF